MSKKKFLLYKKFYSPELPGVLSNTAPRTDKPYKKIPFREVVDYLEKHDYIRCGKNSSLILLPKGVFVQEAILAKAQEFMQKEGASPYRFPSIFSGTKSIKDNLIEKFKESVFTVTAYDNENYYLKYASDPVMFEYFHNQIISTPHKTYSPDYFFRAIKTGEMKPLINPREFCMTDFHFFEENENFDAYIKAASLNKRAMELLVPADRWHLNMDTNESFFKDNYEKIVRMLDTLKVRAVVNITSERTHYYSMQNQYIADYYCGNETQIANLQFDQENGKLFNITSSTTGKAVSVIHGTLFGRTEKIIAIIFGKIVEQINEKKLTPSLPLWTTPIIVRIIPINKTTKIEDYLHLIEEKLSQMKCRYDVDIREIKLDKKIKDAEHDLVPYQIVIGNQEIANSSVSVINRLSNLKYLVSLETFFSDISYIIKESGDLPQTTTKTYIGKQGY